MNFYELFCATFKELLFLHVSQALYNVSRCMKESRLYSIVWNSWSIEGVVTFMWQTNLSFFSGNENPHMNFRNKNKKTYISKDANCVDITQCFSIYSNRMGRLDSLEPQTLSEKLVNFHDAGLITEGRSPEKILSIIISKDKARWQITEDLYWLFTRPLYRLVFLIEAIENF